MANAMGRLVGGGEEASQHLSEVGKSFTATLNRMMMVASPHTVRCVSDYQRAIIRAVSLLRKRNHALTLLKSDIDLARESRESNHSERLRFIEMMRAYNIEGGGDAARFQRIEQQAAYAAELAADAHSRWLQHAHAYETKRVETIREFIDQSAELSRVQAPVLAAIRSELEASDESLALIMEETAKTTEVGVQSLTDQIPLIQDGIEGLRAQIVEDQQQREAAERRKGR